MKFKIKNFIQSEALSGILLLIATVAAMTMANSPFANHYEKFFNSEMIIGYPQFFIVKTLREWVNDGLMSFFFLLVSLEIKREIIEGELNALNKIILPILAALGGMVLPALIYCFFTWDHKELLKGWAIPSATDIAFALGILTLLGKRIPLTLKIFVTAIAIFDDIGAILIIAFFYTQHISLLALIMVLGCALLLALLNHFKIINLTAYLLLGLVLWTCMLKSGIHASLTGVLLAFFIPLRHEDGYSPLIRLEQGINYWVTLVIVPLFALANAGLSLQNLSLQNLLQPLPLGILSGLFIGKQVGILMMTWLAITI